MKIQTVFPVLFCALLLAACGLSPVPATATATIAPTFTATLPVPTPDLSRDTYPGEDIHQTNSNAIGLSPESLALLNNSGFMVVTVNGGSDNPNIVSWCGNGDTCRVSPTPELFIPGGALDLNVGIDPNGFVTFKMVDGSLQKGLVELPKVDGGATWVWGINQVGQDNPGEVWVLLVQNGGGKAGEQPKILGQVKAVFAEGVMVSIEKQGNKIIQTIDGQAANIIDVAPSLPTNLSPEFQAMLADKQWTQEADGHIWVTGADGVKQDWFQLKSDGETYRRTDAKLIADAPNQEWWVENNDIQKEFIEKNAWVIFPEPEKTETVQIVVADGSTITISGPRMIIPDKNDPKTIISFIYPKFMSSTDGWSFERDLAKFCRGNSECADGFKPNTQYFIIYSLFTVSKSQFPITNHLIKVSLAQNINDLIYRMEAGEVNTWPGNLIFGKIILESQKLNP